MNGVTKDGQREREIRERINCSCLFNVVFTTTTVLALTLSARAQASFSMHETFNVQQYGIKILYFEDWKHRQKMLSGYTI